MFNSAKVLNLDIVLIIILTVIVPKEKFDVALNSDVEISRYWSDSESWISGVEYQETRVNVFFNAGNVFNEMKKALFDITKYWNFPV